MTLGEITNESNDTVAAYSVRVASGDPAIPLRNFSFEVKSPIGTVYDLASVCISSPSGEALGVWQGGNWSSGGNATICSPSAQCPVLPGASLVTGYELNYYLGPAVGGGLPSGSYFVLNTKGPDGGSITSVGL